MKPLAISNPANFGRVAVLMGGAAAEREVSLKSGAAVYAALQRLGVQTLAIDVSDNVIKALDGKKIDRVFNIIHGRKSFSGSNIGGIAETQEMLNFCAKHNITADIELIRMQDINTAFERLAKGDVHYRFVIDMASLKK